VQRNSSASPSAGRIRKDGKGKQDGGEGNYGGDLRFVACWRSRFDVEAVLQADKESRLVCWGLLTICLPAISRGKSSRPIGRCRLNRTVVAWHACRGLTFANPGARKSLLGLLSSSPLAHCALGHWCLATAVLFTHYPPPALQQTRFYICCRSNLTYTPSSLLALTIETTFAFNLAD
jgi:hypothetical protein